jgi:RpiR family transcriptional regulator, carbohydrate utilization regulator
MPSLSLSDHIQAKLPKMSQSLQKFANWLWHNADNISHQSMKSCAKAAGVSEPTVMRFCKFLNYSGFQAFREKLNKEFALSKWQPPTQAQIQANPNYALYKEDFTNLNGNLNPINNNSIDNNFIPKHLVFEQTNQALLALNKVLKDNLLNQAIKFLNKAKDIILLADQTSQSISNIFHQQSYIITDQVIFYPDKIMQHICLNLISSEDVILIFSQNKLPKNILKILNKAIKTGAKVILICPLINSSDTSYPQAFKDNENICHLPIIWPDSQYLCISSSPTIQMSLISELLLKGWEEALSEKPKQRKVMISKLLSTSSG